MDDYFLDRELSPRDENGNYNFETIASLDADGLIEILPNADVRLPV